MVGMSLTSNISPSVALISSFFAFFALSASVTFSPSLFISSNSVYLKRCLVRRVLLVLYDSFLSTVGEWRKTAKKKERRATEHPFLRGERSNQSDCAQSIAQTKTVNCLSLCSAFLSFFDSSTDSKNFYTGSEYF